MKEKLIRFALWLGVIEYKQTEREVQQRIDQLMFDLASAATWAEYMNVRWGVPNVNKSPQPQETN